MDYILYYLKQSVITFVYLLGTLIIAVGISMIKGALGLQITLYVLTIIMFLGVSGAFYFVMGKKAVKQSKINYEEREEMLRTGDIKKLSDAATYAPYKGFIIGFCPFIIMIAFIIIEVFSGSSAVLDLLYTIFYGLFRMPLVTLKIPNYFAFYGIILTTVDAGILYLLGAKREIALYKTVEEIDKEIYGE